MPKQSRAQARAIATREAILTSAGQVFSRATYSSATMANVYEHAGITQGALYFHFKTKHELAKELIRHEQHITARAGEIHLRSNKSGLEGLIMTSATLARSIVVDPMMRAGLRLSTESADFFPDTLRGPYQEWILLTKSFLAISRDAREIPEHTDVDAAADLIVSAFVGVQVVADATGVDLELRLREMWTRLIPTFADEGRRRDLVVFVESLGAGGPRSRMLDEAARLLAERPAARGDAKR